MYTDNTPTIDTTDPVHNAYAMAIIEAIVEAAQDAAEGAAIIQTPGTDAESSPWLLSPPPAGRAPIGWQLDRRHAGEWHSVLWFARSIDAAAAFMREFDARHPHDEAAATWWPAELVTIAA